MIEIRPPVPQFFDTDGTPLDNGYIYIGISGANPETSPRAIFWDKAGTIAATQPIRTLNGYPSRDGAIAKFYTATRNYSITVRDKRSVLVASVLNADSGVFDELTDEASAAGIGYDNATGLTATNVQAAIDELKVDIAEAVDQIAETSLSFSGLLNLAANSAFLINQRGYVSGTATGGANQYTLDRWRVVQTGEALSWVSAALGNRITAPAGGLEQVIEGTRISGGEYAATWTGAGTMQVNGTFREKGEIFTLTAGSNVTVRLVGEIEKFMFSRPEFLDRYEYDYQRDLLVCQWYARRILVIAGGGSSSNFWGSAFGATGAVKAFEIGAMRATPTVSLLNNSGIEYYSYAGAWTASTLTSAATVGSSQNLELVVIYSADGDGRGKLLRRSTAGDVVAIVTAEL